MKKGVWLLERRVYDLLSRKLAKIVDFPTHQNKLAEKLLKLVKLLQK